MFQRRSNYLLIHCSNVLCRKSPPAIARYLTINHRRLSDESNSESNNSQSNLTRRIYVPRPDKSASPLTGLSDLPLPAHDSLLSFLNYAEKTNLDNSSAVFRGTKYEYTCLNSLSRLGFDLKRVGGAHDAGIDLLGSWNLPHQATELRTLVQCKFIKKGISPVLLRELEGAFAGSSEDVTIAILCTPSLATKAVRDTLRKCAKPVILMTIDESGWIETIVLNQMVEELVEDIRVGLKYVDGRKEAFLLYKP